MQAIIEIILDPEMVPPPAQNKLPRAILDIYAANIMCEISPG